uniref:Protein aael aael006654 aedes aegypti n=1 Tax=Corethrella appendiculata TaxID=1370023 RepID=U5EYN4_9DIPT
MSDIKELQNDECEALISIYEGDTAFKQIDSCTFQYKYGTDDDKKSILLELKWTENYPNELPTINLDTFYNKSKKLSKNVKEKITTTLNTEGEQWLGCGMTYTLFECLKDKIDELLDGQEIEDIDDSIIVNNDIQLDKSDDENNGEGGDQSRNTSKGTVPKKEQLTKAQKRKQWDRVDNKGNRPRGYNWIDVVKHLSQTGNKDD